MQEHTPERIVSLVPSLTEYMIDLGLKDHLAGRTRFCVEPDGEVDDIPIIGGTKNPNIDEIKALEPDLIIANKEENRKEHIEELAGFTNVYLSEITSVDDALITLHELGRELGVPDSAEKIVDGIMTQLEQRPDEPETTAAYLIWREPWMAVGDQTYIHDVLEKWNVTNVFGYKERYPEITFEHLELLEPDLILLSSEPYPFKQKHVEELEKTFDQSRILLVDGTWFSWYGSRMEWAFKQLNTWRKAIA